MRQRVAHAAVDCGSKNSGALIARFEKALASDSTVAWVCCAPGEMGAAKPLKRRVCEDDIRRCREGREGRETEHAPRARA